jgi:hypothetical protein
MGTYKNAENDFDFPFLERYHADGDEFLSHIVRITGDEIWVSFVNAYTKEHSQQWIYTHSSQTPRKFKQTLSTCQKADGNCLLGQERSADGRIHATRDHSNVISVLRNNKRTALGQNKRRGMLTHGVMLLHDNAHPHTAARTQTLLDVNWVLSDHPLYSSHLDPNDYHLFT